ncbi:MAG TPA: hypothetical protein DCQ04_00255 [Actinobacteria bacterium]|mgnify:CR=1 FL=1|nr:hypothetical protein [Actinomycetota bacterium]
MSEADDETHSELEEQSDKRSSLKRNFALLVGTQMATWSMAIVLSVVTQRVLGTNDYGVLGTAAALWAVAIVIAGLGGNTLVSVDLARDRVRGRSTVANAFAARSVAFSVVAVAAMFIAFKLFDRTTLQVVAIGAVGALFTLQSELSRSALNSVDRFAIMAKLDIVAKIGIVVVGCAVLLLGGGVLAFSGVAAAVSVCVGAMALMRTRQLASGPFRWTREGMIDMSRRGSVYLFTDVVYVVYSQIDVLIIASIASKTEVGYYNSAGLLVGSLVFIPSILMITAFPRMARLHQEDPNAGAMLIGNSIRSIILIAFPTCLGAALVAEQVVVLQGGEAFRPASQVLVVFTVALGAQFLNILLGNYLISIDRTRFFNGLLFCMAAITIPLDLILVPFTRNRFDNGAIGGAMATVITEVIMVVAMATLLGRVILTRRLLVRFAKAGTAAVAMLAAVWPLREEVLPVPIAVGAVTYVGVLILLRAFEPDELELLRGVSRRLSLRRRG